VKVLLVAIILLTLAIIIWQYRRSGDTRKLLVSLASIGVILSLGVAGNLTRAIFPLYITHLLLLAVAWLGLLYYLLRTRYYWWLVLSPAFTIGLFLLLELLEGSGHEYIG